MRDDSRPVKENAVRTFKTHPQRDAALGEVHARPFRPIDAPRVVLHYAFTTTAGQAEADHAWLCDFCASQGAPGPGPSARHHVLDFAGGNLNWERHAEFTTYTWNAPAVSSAPFGSLPGNHPFGAAFRAPGPLLVSTRLELFDLQAGGDWRDHYDPASLTVFKVENGAALAATDFRVDGDGMTRFLVLSDTMSPVQCGAVIQRLLEVETYRTLALLGLFEANRLQPGIAVIEADLVDVTERIRTSSGLDVNRTLLEQLSGLAATLEADAVASVYRFGASRAYHEIVQARLRALGEEPEPGDLSLSAFLGRRLAPAMRTCQSIEERQAMMSSKLARATTLLRTRVDVDLQQQNRNLLESMNRRARLQLRLQQTVEGLSVAAISYYVVGLFSYLAKAVKEVGWPVPSPGITTGIAVPVVIAAIWLAVRRIRKHHAESDADEHLPV